MLELEDKSNPVKRSSGWVSSFSLRKLLIKVMDGNLHTTTNFYSDQIKYSFPEKNKPKRVLVVSQSKEGRVGREVGGLLWW